MNIIRVLLLSGARKTEIASAKGAYLNAEHGALRLPDSKTDEKIIPLGALTLPPTFIQLDVEAGG